MGIYVKLRKGCMAGPYKKARKISDDFYVACPMHGRKIVVHEEFGELLLPEEWAKRCKGFHREDGEVVFRIQFVKGNKKLYGLYDSNAGVIIEPKYLRMDCFCYKDSILILTDDGVFTAFGERIEII